MDHESRPVRFAAKQSLTGPAQRSKCRRRERSRLFAAALFSDYVSAVAKDRRPRSWGTTPYRTIKTFGFDDW
jgi:hypothetical protein